MARSKRSDPLIQLGRRLVEELGLDDESDTLGRWMAHDVAAKMRAAESASARQKAEAQKACSDAILKLWAHRRVLPSGRRPFEDMDYLLRTLDKLGRANGSMYFGDLESWVGIKDASTESKRWLKRALEIDGAARTAIMYCLSAAEAAQGGHRKRWGKLAEAAGLDQEVEVLILNALRDEGSADIGGGVQEARHLGVDRMKIKAAALKEIIAAIEADLTTKAKAIKAQGRPTTRKRSPLKPAKKAATATQGKSRSANKPGPAGSAPSPRTPVPPKQSARKSRAKEPTRK